MLPLYYTGNGWLFSFLYHFASPPFLIWAPSLSCSAHWQASSSRSGNSHYWLYITNSSFYMSNTFHRLLIYSLYAHSLKPIYSHLFFDISVSTLKPNIPNSCLWRVSLAGFSYTKYVAITHIFPFQQLTISLIMQSWATSTFLWSHQHPSQMWSNFKSHKVTLSHASRPTLPWLTYNSTQFSASRRAVSGQRSPGPPGRRSECFHSFDPNQT